MISFRLGIASAITFSVLSITCVQPAQAEFLTSLSVTQTQAQDNKLKYEYIIINLANSDLPVAAFALNISAGANLSSITGPSGWNVEYSPNSTSILWESSDLSLNINSGSEARFSFISSFNPGLNVYEIVGLNGTNIGFNDGQIATPSFASVPEPASIIFLSGGLLAVGGYTWHRRRRNRH